MIWNFSSEEMIAVISQNRCRIAQIVNKDDKDEYTDGQHNKYGSLRKGYDAPWMMQRRLFGHFVVCPFSFEWKCKYFDEIRIHLEQREIQLMSFYYPFAVCIIVDLEWKLSGQLFKLEKNDIMRE